MTLQCNNIRVFSMLLLLSVLVTQVSTLAQTPRDTIDLPGVPEVAGALNVPASSLFVSEVNIVANDSDKAREANGKFARLTPPARDPEGIVGALKSQVPDLNGTVKATLVLKSNLKQEVGFSAYLSIGEVNQKPKATGRVKPSKQATMTFVVRTLASHYPQSCFINIRFKNAAGKNGRRTFVLDMSKGSAELTLEPKMLGL